MKTTRVRGVPASHPGACYIENYFGPGRGGYFVEEEVTMKEYVVGLAFSKQKDRVVLIQKKRAPGNAPHMMGKWNGVGGKLELHESPVMAMSREFFEETSVIVAEEVWKHFLTLKGDSWAVYFFVVIDDAVLHVARTTEDEVVGQWYVNGLPPTIMPNLRWIIPMALGHLDDHVNRYEVVEAEVTPSATTV